MRFVHIHRLIELAADVVAHRRDQDAEQEGHAPAPTVGGRRRDQEGQEKADQTGNDAAHVLAGQLPTTKEAFPLVWRALEQIGGRRPHFAAGRKALQQTCEHEQQGRQHADLGVGRQDTDHAAAERHQPDGQGHRRLAAEAIGIGPDHDSAERPRHKADAKSRDRQQQADIGIVGWKKGLGEPGRENSIDGEVVELQRIADNGRGHPRRGRRRAAGVLTRIHKRTLRKFTLA
jgi:hypothetical protein